MRTVCNFRETHATDKVLYDDHQGGLDSHGVCIPCRDAIIAGLPAATKEGRDEKLA